MPQKHKACPTTGGRSAYFSQNPWQVPLVSGMKTLLFHNPVKKFAKDENDLGKFNGNMLGRIILFIKH